MNDDYRVVAALPRAAGSPQGHTAYKFAVDAVDTVRTAQGADLTNAPSATVALPLRAPKSRSLRNDSYRPKHLARPVTKAFTLFSQDERIDYLKEFGSHTLATSTMQANMEYFDVPGLGYIAYRRQWGSVAVIGDPICAAGNFEIIITAFMQVHPKASFIQVSKPVVEVLHKRFGMYGTRFGTESRIDLSTWSTKGIRKQGLRLAISDAAEQGITFAEGPHRDDMPELAAVSRGSGRFLVRPAAMAFREGTRHFYPYREGEPIAFVSFDPIFEKGRVISYVPTVSRSSAEFRQGFWYALMAAAMDVFKAEGVGHVDLGLSRVTDLDELEPQESKRARKAFDLVLRQAQRLCNVDGVGFAKRRFGATVTRTYACHPTALPAFKIVALARIAEVI